MSGKPTAVKVARQKDIERFYRRVPWDKWWDEFIAARESSGALIYATVWAFARAKGKNAFEQQVIYWCVGPQPRQKDGSKGKYPVKWLGDWQTLRNEMFYYSESKAEALKKMLEKNGTALEAAHGVAHVALDWIAKTDRWQQQVTEHFRDVILVPGAKEKSNRSRANLFFDLQERLMAMQMQSVNLFLKCHGVGEDDISVLAQMAAVGARAALTGVAVANGSDPALPPSSPVLASIMNTFLQKSKIYNLAMPEVDEPEHRRPVIEQPEEEHAPEEEREMVKA